MSNADQINMSDGNEALPEGWVEAPLPDLCDIIMGQSPPSSTYREKPEGLPFFQGKAEFGDLHPTPRKWCVEPNKIAEANDILLSIRAPVGPTNLASERCCVGRGLAALRPVGDIELKFVLHSLRHLEEKLESLATGTTFKAVSGRVVSSFEVRVPPAPEQHRIVSKIESLQERSSRAREALAEVGPLLEQFRQSVLQAAFSGRLTADWRAKNPDVEPASELLVRIRKERRARWEAAELEKYEAKGKQPPKNWQGKYKEPEAVDESDLPELPGGWCWTSIDALTFDGPQNGLYVPRTKYGTGTPILRIDDYQIDWCRPVSQLQCVDIDEATAKTYALAAADLVINRVNSPSHLGKTIVIADENIPAVFESNMMRLEVSSPREATYVHYFLTSSLGKSLLTKNAKWAVNQASINQGDVCESAIPLAPAPEQKEIIRLVAESHSSLGEVENILTASESNLTQLDQSILAKAFRGELVPQDPSDEPALVLLERIRASRKTAETNKPKRKHNRRVSNRAKADLPAATSAKEPSPATKLPTRPCAERNGATLSSQGSQPAEFDTDEVVAHFRAAFWGCDELTEEELLRAVADRLGYQRMSPTRRQELKGHLKAAIRRQAVARDDELLTCPTSIFRNYEQDFLLKKLFTVMRRGQEYERAEVARNLAHHLGYRSISAGMKKQFKSLFNSAIRRGVIQAKGKTVWRE